MQVRGAQGHLKFRKDAAGALHCVCIRTAVMVKHGGDGQVICKWMHVLILLKAMFGIDVSMKIHR